MSAAERVNAFVADYEHRCGRSRYGAAVLVALQPPVWSMLLLGPMTLATLYIIARKRSRFDPLDPRFGSCIPPITRPGDKTAVSGRSAPEG